MIFLEYPPRELGVLQVQPTPKPLNRILNPPCAAVGSFQVQPIGPV